MGQLSGSAGRSLATTESHSLDRGCAPRVAHRSSGADAVFGAVATALVGVAIAERAVAILRAGVTDLAEARRQTETDALASDPADCRARERIRAPLKSNSAAFSGADHRQHHFEPA